MARSTVTAERALDARGLQVALRATEHWKHNVTTTDAQGHTSTHVETERKDLVHEPVAVSGELHLGPGETRSWDIQLPVPPLGPATLEADVAGLDWVAFANIDVPGGMDPGIEAPVRVVQPVALLRSGAVTARRIRAVRRGGCRRGRPHRYDHPRSPPHLLGSTVHGEGDAPCRDHAEAAGDPGRASRSREGHGADGLEEDVIAWSGSVATTELSGDREIELSGTLAAAALPSIELPHGRADATFHVILATAWAPDPHLVRDVAIATTLEL